MSKKSSPSPFPDKDYQRESDHRTLTSAAEIMGDKDRMRGAKAHHRKQGKAMSLVQKTMLSGRR